MFDAPVEEFLAPFNGSFRIAAMPTGPAQAFSRKKNPIRQHVRRIARAQEVLYAHDRYAVLLVFQAMDAAGKDGTIRAVMSGVNPAGCHVSSFKKPSAAELDHDFLWRTSRQLPERGRIGVFNRSHYEEVLVVRVHPEFLEAQRLPVEHNHDDIWEQRLESIREHELHLARNGVIIVKFFLHVSRDEQRRRFLSRLRKPEKHWKFSPRDVEESEHWPEYMAAYEAALNGTSRPWAPWYVIPADDKPFMRHQVAKTIADSIESLGTSYPQPDQVTLATFGEYRKRLRAQSRG